MVVFKETLIFSCPRLESPSFGEIIKSKQQKSPSVWKRKDAKQNGRQNCEVHVFPVMLDWLRLDQVLFLYVSASGKDEIYKAVRNMYLG